MSRRELFGSLCAMVFLVNLARVVFAPLIQPAAADFQVSAASLGIVASAAWLGSAAPRLPTGYLLTKIPRHHVVAATGTLLVFTAAFTGFSNSITHLTVGAFLMGLSSGMYYVSALPLVSELFPERVGRAVGIHGMGSQIAAVGAPLAVSVVLLAGNWRFVFACISVAAAITTLALLWTARRTRLPEAGADDHSLIDAGRAQWPLILTGIAFISAAGFLWNGLFNLYGDYLEIAKGIDPATGRLLLSGMFAAGLPAFVVTGYLCDRFPNVPLLLTMIGGFVAGVFALTVADGLLVIAAVSLFVGYFFHSLLPAVDAYMLSSLPDHNRASAYALFSATMMLLQAPGSGFVGWSVTRGVSYTVTFQLLAIGVGSVVVAMLILYKMDRLPTGGTPGETVSAG